MPRVHHPARHQNGGHVDPPDAHQVGGHRLVAAGDEHATVKGRGHGVNLKHVGNHVPAGQGVVHAVVSLRHAVADVGGEVSRRPAARTGHGGHNLLRQAQQMRAAGMAVAKGAFHHDLRFTKILHGPAHAHAQRILLRGQGAYVLTDQVFGLLNRRL